MESVLACSLLQSIKLSVMNLSQPQTFHTDSFNEVQEQACFKTKCASPPHVIAFHLPNNPHQSVSSN